MMSQKRKKIFVMVIPQFEDIFHSFYAGEIIKGASMAASRLNVDVLIHITDRKDHRTWLDSSLLDRKFVDGIIFADIDNDVEVVKRAIKQGMPTVILNNYFDEPFNCISIDNYQAAYNAVSHLIKLGHKEIATIAGDLSTQAGEMRLAGYYQALKDAGIKVSKRFVACGDFLRTPAKIAAQKLLKSKNRPSAVFAASDVMALEVIDVAKKNGISVPQDLSVIGFDDNPLNGSSPVPLSTVYQPLVEMGRLGVEQMKLISDAKAKLPVKMMLSAKLCIRRSTTKVTVA